MEEAPWHAPHVRGAEPGLRNGQRWHMTEQEALLTQILEEQRKTNQLLLMLIEAMGEEAERDEEPSTYMDGSKVI